jgi:CheY-like chemotaxis protein
MLKKKILVAEDDEDDQHFLRVFLRDRQDIILLPIAENGIVLMKQLESMGNTEEMPDIIIIDQNMPKQNGLQTLQLLKHSSRYVHIPVIIYSTYTDETLVKNGSELGACQVVSKPVTKEGYDQMMDQIFEACI